MLAGRCPFESNDVRWVVHQVIHQPPPPLGRDVSPALERLLFDGLLAKSPEQRVQTMTEIGALLDTLIAAQQSGVPRALETFDETQPVELDMIWSVEDLLDAPARLDAVPRAVRDLDACA